MCLLRGSRKEYPAEAGRHHATLRHAMPCHAMPCHATPRHATPLYVSRFVVFAAWCRAGRGGAGRGGAKGRGAAGHPAICCGYNGAAIRAQATGAGWKRPGVGVGVEMGVAVGVGEALKPSKYRACSGSAGINKHSLSDQDGSHNHNTAIINHLMVLKG